MSKIFATYAKTFFQGLNLPAGYVVIELDDGDSRDFHVDSIRILPPDYPIVGKILDTATRLSYSR